MESRASSTCWLCGRRRGGRLALSAGIAWPRFRRDAVGPGLAGVERAEQMNSLKEIRRIAGERYASRRREDCASEWPIRRADSIPIRPDQGVSMAWRQQKRDVLDVQVYGVTFLLYRCVLSHTLHRLPLPVTAQIRRAGGSILRHVPPRSALRLLSSQASSPQQHSSPSALSGSFATSCVPSSRLGSR